MAEKKEMTLASLYSSFIWKMRPSTKIVGREYETEQLMELLCKKRMRNLILIGYPGVGKTELVRHIASLAKNCVFYEWNITASLTETEYRGQFEGKITRMLKRAKEESKKTGKTIILFVDECHMIFGAGQSRDEKLDLSNILKSYLSNSDVVIWGATTIDEYNQVVKKDGAFRRRFTTLVLKEVNGDQIRKITKNFSEGKLNDSEIDDVFRLSNGIEWMHQPDAAIELADRCMAHKEYAGIDCLTTDEIEKIADTMDNAEIE